MSTAEDKSTSCPDVHNLSTQENSMSKVVAIATLPPVATRPVTPSVGHLPLLDRSTLPNTVLMQTLGRALTLRRDHGSVTEGEFVGWLVNRLPVTMIDAAGNVHVDLRSQPHHRTMFTAHTDTVHSSGGTNPVRVDGDKWRADGAALGADDGAGVALLCHLIEAGVPGLYVFFRGEECGGVGSAWLAEHMVDLFADIDRAVAFDRADYYDVITHQSGGRCCSDAFAQALCDQLALSDLLLMPDETGVYTDTAEFTHLVAECTNVSVGYKYQHGDREEQDVPHLVKLADALVLVEWDTLPVVRDHTESRWGKYADVYMPANWPKNDRPSSGRNSIDDYYDELDRAVSRGKLGDRYRDNPTDYEEEVIEALESCLSGGKRSKLATLIAQAVSPESPEFARRNMNMGRLSEDVLLKAIDDLYEGWDADTVLADLFQDCCTV